MAVKVKGHETSKITFTYTTPMLREGTVISMIGGGIFLIYLAVCFIIGRKRTIKQACKRAYRMKYHIKQTSNI